MQHILSCIRLLLRAFFCRLTDKPLRLSFPQVQHPTAAAAAPGRFQKQGRFFTDNGDKSRVTVLLAGDLMCQRKQQNAAKTKNGYNFTPNFRCICDTLRSADLTIGNLEAAVSPAAPYMHELPFSDGLPHLNAPGEWLHALREAGFDALVNANNHCCDAGRQGIEDTLAALDASGFPHTGLFGNATEQRYLLLRTGGICIALLSYATAFNFKSGCLTKAERQLLLNRYSAKKAAADIAAAKKDGADYVIVYLHWGIEYTRKPTPGQKRIARQLAGCGCDFLAGSHPHVLQPLTKIGQMPCIWSLGNFISSQTKKGTQDAVLLRLTLEKKDGKTALIDLESLPIHTLAGEAETDFHTIPTAD